LTRINALAYLGANEDKGKSFYETENVIERFSGNSWG